MPKRKKTSEEIIAEQQRLADVHKAHLEARLKAIEQEKRKLKEMERKRDLRRAVLITAFQYQCIKTNHFPITARQYRAELLASLHTDKDRALFNDTFWADFALVSESVGAKETATRSEPLSSQPQPIQAKRQE